MTDMIKALEFYYDKEKQQKCEDSETMLHVMEFAEWTPQKGAVAIYYLHNPNPDQVFSLYRMNGKSVFEFTAIFPDGEGNLHKTELGTVSHPEAVLPLESVELRLEIAPISDYAEMSSAELAWYQQGELMLQFQIVDGKIPIFPLGRWRVWKMTAGRNHPNV